MVFAMLQILTKQNIKTMSHLLEIKNLDVKFDTDEGRITAIDNVSLKLDQGKVLGIVGESGSGKSVTAKSIMQLNPGNTIYNDDAQMLAVAKLAQPIQKRDDVDMNFVVRWDY